jgi:hypothetical protein
VRIRITQSLSGSIDGIQLGRYEAGHTYDVGTSLACYLLAIGAAQPVGAEQPALLAPLDSTLLEEIRKKVRTVTEPATEAADEPAGKPARRRKPR